MKKNPNAEAYKLRVLIVAAQSGFANISEVMEIGLTDFAHQFKQLSMAKANAYRATKEMAYLVGLAETNPQPLIWLKKEMAFELLIAQGSDRKALAAAHLALGQLDDTELDLYNDRIRRTF